MKKHLKRRLYALALAGLIMSGVNTRAFAESIDDVDMSPIDIEQAIAELIPQNKNNSGNNGGNNNNNNGNNSNTNNKVNHVNHSYNDVADEIINQKNPTCDMPGSYDEVYYCKDCGDANLVHIEVPALDHKWATSSEKINETSTGYDFVEYCVNKGCNETRTYHVITNTPTEPQTSISTNCSNEKCKSCDGLCVFLAGSALFVSSADLAALAYLIYQNNSKKKSKGKYLSKK